MSAPVLIGTSGWQYRDWRERFYPPKLAQNRWLEFYSERFKTVEVNNTFYRLPEAGTFVQWRERTPADFVAVIKVSRYLTHIKRLQEPQEPVTRMMERATGLGSKLGPLLLQLPPNLQMDIDALNETLSAFPSTVRLAVEFRHPSWFTDSVRKTLVRHGAAYCLSDRRSRTLGPMWRTADWGYLRMHEGVARPNPCYGQGSLKSWAKRLSEGWKDATEIFVFFNNDPLGCAVRDAIAFAAEVERVGLVPTRVPDRAEVQVG